MSLNIPARAYNAMGKQANRVQRELTPADEIRDLKLKLAQAERDRDTALAEVKRLNEENDILAVKAHHARKSTGSASTGKFHDGVEYVNQTEAAAILKVEQYQISRWVAAKKFQMMTVPGIKKQQIVRSSLVKPARGTPGRKKK